jgi:hypothetical protein
MWRGAERGERESIPVFDTHPPFQKAVLLADIHSLIRGPPAECRSRLHPRTTCMTGCEGLATAALSTHTGP